MKRRLIFLAAILTGVALFAFLFPPQADVVPFPLVSNTKVRFELPVRFSGEYRVEVSTPKVDNKLRLDNEIFSCNFRVTVEESSRQLASNNIETISSTGELGWANIQSFSPEYSINLDHGTYQITVTSGSTCPVAATRGASVTMRRFETEHILGSLLIMLVAPIFIVGGIVGLTFSGLSLRPKPDSNQTTT